MKYLVFASLLTLGAFASECHPKYECCKKCNVVYTDKEGQWGVENKNWCFIQEDHCNKDNVSSKYPTCTHCNVYYTDATGDWGVENKDWCFIDETKCKEPEPEPEPEKEKDEKSSTSTPVVTQLHNVPIISIFSETGKNDFANLPVEKHVSDISYWGMEKPPYPYYENCTFTVEDEYGEKVIENVTGKTRVRGNWTTDYAKKSFRINFDEKQNLLGLNEGQKFKNWLLLAEYKDNSLLRSKTSFDLSREILADEGLYVTDSKIVELNINGEYYGVYLLAEVQQVNKGRVNITKVKKDYTGTDIGYLLEYDTVYAKYEDPLQSINMRYNDNAPLTPFDGEGGNGITINAITDNMKGFTWEDYFIYGIEEEGEGEKEEKEEDGEQTEGSEVFEESEELSDDEVFVVDEAYVSKVLNMSIKSDIYSQEQHDFIAKYINNVYKIMYEAAYNKNTLKFNEDYTDIVEAPELTPKEAIENVVDVTSLADMYIISELACDADLYFSSFYMDVDFGKDGSKKLRFEAPWDFDSSLGNRKSCLNGEGFWAGNRNEDCNVPNTYQINPWLAVIMYEDWYQEIIKNKWSKAYDNGVFSRIIDNVLEDSKKYEEAFTRDYEKWDGEVRRQHIGTEVSIQEQVSKTEADSATYLSEWLEARVNFINKYWHN